MKPQSKENKWIVVTTINPPTTAIKAIAELCRTGWSAVVVGDTKTSPDWHAEGIHYLSVDKQKEIFGDYAVMIPYRHYCRKNLGYLYALSRGAECILETDDDNIPYPQFGKSLERKVTGRSLDQKGWANIYKLFSPENIWPRGLPLDEIHTAVNVTGEAKEADCPIQQYLADSDPDVDAIFRLTFKGTFDFDPNASPVVLKRGSWAPFNSQNTLFFQDSFPLLYLPCHVSFRMTDIWRSFVAQAALWVHGKQVAFRTATVKQIRNEHNLMKDFADELVGYLENRKIAVTLEKVVQQLLAEGPNDIPSTAFALWKSLESIGIIPAKEIPLIEKWFELVSAPGAGVPETR